MEFIIILILWFIIDLFVYHTTMIQYGDCIEIIDWIFIVILVTIFGPIILCGTALDLTFSSMAVPEEEENELNE